MNHQILGIHSVAHQAIPLSKVHHVHHINEYADETSADFSNDGEDSISTSKASSVVSSSRLKYIVDNRCKQFQDISFTAMIVRLVSCTIALEGTIGSTNAGAAKNGFGATTTRTIIVPTLIF